MTCFDSGEFPLYLRLVDEILLDFVIWKLQLAVYYKKKSKTYSCACMCRQGDWKVQRKSLSCYYPRGLKAFACSTWWTEDSTTTAENGCKYEKAEDGFEAVCEQGTQNPSSQQRLQQIRRSGYVSGRAKRRCCRLYFGSRPAGTVGGPS